MSYMSACLVSPEEYYGSKHEPAIWEVLELRDNIIDKHPNDSEEIHNDVDAFLADDDQQGAWDYLQNIW